MTPVTDNTDLGPELSDDNASTELVHNLLRLVQIARHRRNTILQALCVTTVIGATYYALAPRQYDSTAKLLIVQRNQDIASVGDQPGLDNTMATHRELVVSPVVIQEAIEHLLPEHRIDMQESPPSQWGRILGGRLSAKTTRRTNIVEVSYRSLSPDAAAAVVSAVVSAYLQFVERTHQGSAGDIVAVLSGEREQLTHSLTAKQNELQAFRQNVGHISGNTDGRVVDPLIQRALKLNDALMDVQQNRLQLQASRLTVRGAIERGENLQQHLAALEQLVGQQMLISALGLSPQDMQLVIQQEQRLLDAQSELQSLLPFYGPVHPKVAELQDRVQSIERYLAGYRAQAGQRFEAFDNQQWGPLIENMLDQSLAQVWQREQQLLTSFEQARSEAARQSGELVQLQMMEREVARLESLHDVLFDRIASVDIHQLQAPIQATVVQEALPDDVPSTPQLRLIAFASLMGGLVLGAVAAYVQDVLDDRFASPEEMSAQLHVHVLTMVRRLDALEGVGLTSVHTYVEPNAVEAEAFRTLRTALTLSAGNTDRIAISSAEPGDGKTTIAINLAVSFAQAGKKTLVIDADLRKPGMTAMMALKGRPGVADVLYGAGDPAQAAVEWVHRSELAGLDILPAGLRRPNPAELLSGQNFVELLAWAESKYDKVIVDCPPVLAVSDAQIVGRLVDGAILVVQPHKNHRRLVARACDSFTAIGGTVLGVVANGLSPESARGYGYSYGYGYGYGHDAEGTDTGDADVDEASTMHLVNASSTRRAA